MWWKIHCYAFVQFHYTSIWVHTLDVTTVSTTLVLAKFRFNTTSCSVVSCRVTWNWRRRRLSCTHAVLSRFVFWSERYLTLKCRGIYKTVRRVKHRTKRKHTVYLSGPWVTQRLVFAPKFKGQLGSLERSWTSVYLQFILNLVSSEAFSLSVAVRAEQWLLFGNVDEANSVCLMVTSLPHSTGSECEQIW